MSIDFNFHDIIDRIVNGEEISIKENKITSVFRLATEEDIANAERDEISFRKELDDFIKSNVYLKKTF